MKLNVPILPFLILGPSFRPPFLAHQPLHYIDLPSDPDPPFVDQAGTYLSTCPISHLPLLSVSCNDQNHTVQESFPINTASTFVGAFNAEMTSFP